MVVRMKNKLSILGIIIFFALFSMINGKYVVISALTYIISFLITEKKEKKINLFGICYAIVFLFLNILIIKFLLNEFFTDTIEKNIFSSLYIIIYSYIFSDIKLVCKLYYEIKKKCKELRIKWKKLVKSKKYLWILPNNLWVFFLFLLSIYTFVSFAKNTANDFVNVYSQPRADEIVEVLNDTKVDIDFIDNDENFTHLCFIFGTFERNNTSNLTFYVKDNDKIIIKEKFNTGKLRNNQNKCFNIKKIPLSILKKYDIYFSPDAKVKKGNSVAIFKDSKTGNIALTLSAKQKNNVSYFKMFFYIYSFIIFLIINYLINSKRISFEKFYIYTLMYMIPILFIYPAFTVPDEPHHFYRAYANSQIFDSNFIFNGFDNTLTTVPQNINCLNYSNFEKADKVQDFNKITSCAKEMKNKKEYNAHTGMAPFLGYIPQAIGIKIADAFVNSPLIIFYFGRFLSFVFCFFIVYKAIKITPKYKSIFLFTATMMMFIQQIISYSYDAILNSFSLLFVASVLKMICSKDKIKFQDFIVPFICYCIIVNIKMVYFTLGIMLLFIPKNRFNKNKYLSIILFFLLSLTILKGIDYLISFGLKNNSTNVIINSDANKQLTYLIKNPLFILKIALNTIKCNTLIYIRGIVGHFGWFTFKVNDIFILIYFLIIIYIINCEKSIISKKNKIMLLSCILISVIAIFGAMYLLWTDYRGLVVDGVQGRYFIPLLIPLIICVIPKNPKFKLDNNILYSVINVCLLQLILILLAWFY